MYIGPCILLEETFLKRKRVSRFFAISLQTIVPLLWGEFRYETRPCHVCLARNSAPVSAWCSSEGIGNTEFGFSWCYLIPWFLFINNSRHITFTCCLLIFHFHFLSYLSHFAFLLVSSRQVGIVVILCWNVCARSIQLDSWRVLQLEVFELYSVYRIEYRDHHSPDFFCLAFMITFPSQSTLYAPSSELHWIT
jgi:hypothetical protein